MTLALEVPFARERRRIDSRGVARVAAERKRQRFDRDGERVGNRYVVVVVAGVWTAGASTAMEQPTTRIGPGTVVVPSKAL